MAARDLPREPRAFAVDSDDWPDGELVADAPAPASAARALARNLRRELSKQGVSLRALASEVGVDHATISRVIAGRRYCDIATLAKLEAGLRVSLWPEYRDWSGHSDGVDD